MKLQTLFDQKKVVFSLEIFPPKKTASIQTIYDTLDALSDVSPDFISVTYGAGGNPADRSTVQIASTIKHQYHIEPLAHLTCVNSTREHIGLVLDDLRGERGGKHSGPARGSQPQRPAADRLPLRLRPDPGGRAVWRLRHRRRLLPRGAPGGQGPLRRTSST